MAKYTIPTKTCQNCGNEFTKAPTCSKTEWKKRLGCSKSCAAKLRGAPWLESYKMKPGSTLGKATRFNTQRTEGELNSKWKGDSASYAAKHIWVKYHYGKADHCEHCGAEEPRMYHWSNISGQYRRDINDWQQLCVPCHKKYDMNLASA